MWLIVVIAMCDLIVDVLAAVDAATHFVVVACCSNRFFLLLLDGVGDAAIVFVQQPVKSSRQNKPSSSAKENIAVNAIFCVCVLFWYDFHSLPGKTFRKVAKSLIFTRGSDFFLFPPFARK